MSYFICHMKYGITILHFALWSVTGQILRLPLRSLLFLLAPQVKEQRQQGSQREDREDSQQAHQNQAVRPAIRVVHITVKDDLIGERSDSSGRSVDHSEADVERRVFDPVKITRELALRRQDHNAAGVAVLLRYRVPDVAKADGLRQCLNRRLVAGQELPARFRAGPVIPGQIFRLLRRRQLGPFTRVETHGQIDELLAGRHRQPLHSAEQAVQNLRAEARAVVIDQRQNDRLVFEILRQLHRSSVLISEFQIERNLIVQKLVYADVL